MPLFAISLQQAFSRLIVIAKNKIVKKGMMSKRSPQKTSFFKQNNLSGREM
jgi:hypothetical protein